MPLRSVVDAFEKTLMVSLACGSLGRDTMRLLVALRNRLVTVEDIDFFDCSEEVREDWR